MRALRVDKMVYAALEATLADYVSERAIERVPVMRMLALAPGEIEARARAVAARVKAAGFAYDVIDGTSMIGGGSAPGLPVPTRLLAVTMAGLTPAALAARLRGATPPLVARVENDLVILDLRTVLPEQDEDVVRCLNAVASS
jgi:L-seryl-tRNA(Ser) seleniumtransferase